MTGITQVGQIPTQDKISESSGRATRAWIDFFRYLKGMADPMGAEKNHTLINAKTTLASGGDTDERKAQDNIAGLAFDSRFVSHAIVEYSIQRVTSTNRAVAAGMFHVVYKPEVDPFTPSTWAIVLVGTPGPDTSGITFSVTAAGQVQYTSTDITGTTAISRIIFRARTLAGKHQSYSSAGN